MIHWHFEDDPHHASATQTWQQQQCTGLSLTSRQIVPELIVLQLLLFVRLLDCTTNTGLTALHHAAWKGQAGALKQLVNAGAALAAPASTDTMGLVSANAGSTPLHLATMKVRASNRSSYAVAGDVI